MQNKSARRAAAFFLAIPILTGIFSPLARAAEPESMSGTVLRDTLADPAVDKFEIDMGITGYYSPLPGQEVYATGNYENDKILNGNGTNGASGAEVFVGMVAAPPEFPFGTKVYIPGLGLAEVQDRGGAIKGQRLDVWLGKGDEGLARALRWGKRTKRVTVFKPGAEIPAAFASRTIASSYFFEADENKSLSDFEKRMLAAASAPVFAKLVPGSKGARVAELQENLRSLGYFDFPQTTEYFGTVTASAVRDFQTATGLSATGIFDQKTAEKLTVLVDARENRGRIRVQTGGDAGTDGGLLTENFTLGSTGAGVGILQTRLRGLGFFPDDAEISEYFDLQTALAVFEFQKAQGLAKNLQSVGAGVFGPKTRDALRAVLRGEKSSGGVRISLAPAA